MRQNVARDDIASIALAFLIYTVLPFSTLYLIVFLFCWAFGSESLSDSGGVWNIQGRHAFATTYGIHWLIVIIADLRLDAQLTLDGAGLGRSRTGRMAAVLLDAHSSFVL